jgi:hypothetical protein
VRPGIDANHVDTDFDIHVGIHVDFYTDIGDVSMPSFAPSLLP